MYVGAMTALGIGLRRRDRPEQSERAERSVPHMVAFCWGGDCHCDDASATLGVSEERWDSGVQMSHPTRLDGYAG